ncbi:MAG: DUF4160 domain-containing protein [Spirochaetaceae bacterium]|nr:DUF4160 domain-containing protein [Spirochaetaceae bacterium]
MPQVFSVGSYLVFIWVNEGKPLEPIHVHISEKRPTKKSTKVWITSAGKCLLANNDSKIPSTALKNIMRIIEIRSFEIIQKWKDTFGEISFYC